MDWRDLALKAAEQITDENWIQEELWVTTDDECWTLHDGWDYEDVQPVKACVVGHLFWVAKGQGLTYDQAQDLVDQIQDQPQPLARSLVTYNDTHGRTADEVAERLRRLATE